VRASGVNEDVSGGVRGQSFEARPLSPDLAPDPDLKDCRNGSGAGSGVRSGLGSPSYN